LAKAVVDALEVVKVDQMEDQVHRLSRGGAAVRVGAVRGGHVRIDLP
jgi:hypothetical protein